FLRADESNPTPATAARIAEAYLSLRDPEAALRYVPRAAQAGEPLTRALALQRWGMVLQQVGRIPEAEQRFREGIAAYPSDPQNALSLAALLAGTRRAGEAEGVLRAAIASARDPEQKAQAESALARLLDQAGRADEALDHYRNA